MNNARAKDNQDTLWGRKIPQSTKQQFLVQKASNSLVCSNRNIARSAEIERSKSARRQPARALHRAYAVIRAISQRRAIATVANSAL